MEKERILQKISAIGSAYSFKEHKYATVEKERTGGGVEEKKVPIGTAYSRVNPAKEINSKERDTFWRKEEEEEKKRVNLENERKRLEMVKVEEERRAREEKEHTERERRITLEIDTQQQQQQQQTTTPISSSLSSPQR